VPKALTTKSIEQAKCPSDKKRIEIPDALLPGHYLVVQHTGRKAFAVRYRHEGFPCKYTIGAPPAVNLRTARREARRILQLVAEGTNPAAQKKAHRDDAATGRNRVSTRMRTANAIDKIEAGFDQAVKAALELDCQEFAQLAKPTPAEARAFRDWRMEFLRDWKRTKVQLLILDIMGVTLASAPARLQ
jgi:hypothetical protein